MGAHESKNHIFHAHTNHLINNHKLGNNAQQGLAFASLGRNIDLFTQKAPFDGKGPNQPSDAFQPQELVILYALVTYNEGPAAGKLVAFQVNGPADALQNITICAVSQTNEDGIAEWSFRIPWPAENAEEIVFGQKYAIATVDIAEIVVNDTLTFQVGWTVRIKNIATLDAELKPQTNFLRQSTIIFDLTLGNIAFTSKTGTITIDAQDVAEYPIMILQPGENHIQASSVILLNARIGEAKVSAKAYTSPPLLEEYLTALLLTLPSISLQETLRYYRLCPQKQLQKSAKQYK